MGASILKSASLILLLAGCATGHSRLGPEMVDTGLSESVTDLEGGAYRDEAGKVLARAIRQQGGWRALLALTRVSYLLTREADDQSESVQFRFDEQELQEVFASVSLAAESEVVDLRSLVLCFALTSPRYEREYLGVEFEARTGTAFDKVRFGRRDDLRDEWLIAYFGRSSGLLQRVLQQERKNFVQVLFSGWQEAGGVKFPTRREVFQLGQSLFRHRDPEQPDRVLALTDLHAE